MENLTEKVENMAINIKSELLEKCLLINVILDSSPSLKQYLPELFYSAYTNAVRKLNRYIEVATPKECEWSLNQIIDENFYPKII